MAAPRGVGWASAGAYTDLLPARPRVPSWPPRTGQGGGTTIGTPTEAVLRVPATRFERYVPGLRAVRTYERAWLSRDLVAAVVLSALLVPQGMAYAELAGLPAITGLYTTVVCLLAYAFVG